MGGALSAGTVFGWSAPAQHRLIDEREYGFLISEVCIFANLTVTPTI